MNKLLLPNGLQVSEVALGAMMFGSATSKKESYEVLDTYIDLGGNFIDTSNNYAHWAGTGDESETLLGEWLKDRGCRDRVVLATKVGFDRHGEGAGLKKEQIEYWVDESLRKLGTDYIDLYYAHTDDPHTPMWCAVVYPTGGRVSLDFDNDVVKYLGIWVNPGALNGMYNLAVEPCSAPYDDPIRAEAAGKGSYIAPGATVEFTLKISYSEDKK